MFFLHRKHLKHTAQSLPVVISVVASVVNSVVTPESNWLTVNKKHLKHISTVEINTVKRLKSNQYTSS